MSKVRLAHVGIHQSLNRNAGDTLLFEEVRRLIENRLGPIEWVPVQLWELFDLEMAVHLSEEVHGVVVGGGGLLLRDQAGADTSGSGWQWNATTEAIRALSVPLIVFAIGYNRFRGHPEFDSPFEDNIRAVVESSAFCGLRNWGSIRSVARYLDAGWDERLTLQPCPTTVAWQLHPDLRAIAAAHDAEDRRVLRFNVAFDRPDLRFGRNPHLPLTRLAAAVTKAQQAGWEIRVTCHKEQDRQIIPFLERERCPFVVDDLTDADGAGVLEAYARCDLVVGLRGHAQMIPFGLRRPIISIISHDKMAWFLDDIGHPDWGIEILDPQLVERVGVEIERVASDRAGRLVQAAAAQGRQWELTSVNVDAIASILEPVPTVPGAREAIT
ncbi:MAG: hypothetical protein GY929_17980 [Actinomycetia bacterium]|nr:hypothetical protein [Actinomycetes bacterium]